MKHLIRIWNGLLTIGIATAGIGLLLLLGVFGFLYIDVEKRKHTPMGW